MFTALVSVPKSEDSKQKDGMSTTPRVLLVEDDEDYAHFVKRLFNRIGHEAPLDVVHDEKGALQALNRVQYDVVVSDYELRPGSGVHVLEQVRLKSPRAQRILLTNVPETARKELSQGESAVDQIWNKHWEVGTIQEQLRNLLRPTR